MTGLTDAPVVLFELLPSDNLKHDGPVFKLLPCNKTIALRITLLLERKLLLAEFITLASDRSTLCEPPSPQTTHGRDRWLLFRRIRQDVPK